MEFIEPDRSNYIVSAHKPNDEGVRDIGFVKGTFLDGRPYRLECWCMDELIMASVFFDERYLTAWKRLDFALLLELEGVLQFKDGPYLQAGRMKDGKGHGIWTVTVMLKDDDGLHAEVLTPVQRYR